MRQSNCRAGRTRGSLNRTVNGPERRRAPGSRRSRTRRVTSGRRTPIETRAVRRAFRGQQAPGRAVGTDRPRGELPDRFATCSFLVLLHTARTSGSCGRSRHLWIRGARVCSAKPSETARTPPLDGISRTRVEPAGRGESKGDLRGSTWWAIGPAIGGSRGTGDDVRRVRRVGARARGVRHSVWSGDGRARRGGSRTRLGSLVGGVAPTAGSVRGERARGRRARLRRGDRGARRAGVAWRPLPNTAAVWRSGG